MPNKIEDLVSYFLVGKRIKDEQLSEFTERWTEPQVDKEIAKVEERYLALTNNPIADYTGIQIFAEMIKKVRGFPDYQFREGHQRVVRAAQKRVLHYHHLQYEREKNNGKSTTGSNTKLLNQNKD